VLRGWTFAGILAQLPLIGLTNWTARKLKNDQAGNITFVLAVSLVLHL
jgi:hypothetical protein